VCRLPQVATEARDGEGKGHEEEEHCEGRAAVRTLPENDVPDDYDGPWCMMPDPDDHDRLEKFCNKPAPLHKLEAGGVVFSLCAQHAQEYDEAYFDEMGKEPPKDFD